MANAHYSADWRLNPVPLRIPPRPRGATRSPLRFTGVPILARELTAPAVIPLYMLADAEHYVGHTGRHCRPGRAAWTTPFLTGTSPGVPLISRSST